MASSDEQVEALAELLHSLFCGKRQLDHGAQADGRDEDNARLILSALDYERPRPSD